MLAHTKHSNIRVGRWNRWTEKGVLALYMLLRDGCPEGQEAIVIGHNMTSDDLKELRELILEIIESGNRLYVALQKDMDITVEYYENFREGK